MRVRSSLAFFVAILFATSGFAATTTVRFCNDSTDGSTYGDNRTASGWSFTDIGADDTKTSGTYSHPVKFKGSTRGQSAATPSGSYLTEVVLGVWIGNTARTVTVTPLLESGSSGTAQTEAPSSTSGLIEMPFSFSLANCVTGVTVSIAASGNSTAYLYYATVTTETPSGGGNTAPTALQPSVDVAATVGVAAELDLADYFSDADGDPLTYSIESGVGAVSGSIWSFTPESAGSFSAVVSATDPSGAFATMTINATATADGLFLATVFNEGFSGNAGTWGGQAILSSEGDLDVSKTDVDTWYGNNLYNAPSALRLGNSGKHGWARSPAVPFSNAVSSASVTVSFSAAALAAAAENRLVFSVLDASGNTLQIEDVSPRTLLLPVLSLSGSSPTLANALSASNALPQSFSFTAPAGFRMKFDASQGSANSNIAIDDVVVTQVYDPNFVALDPPTGVADSNVAPTGFTVSWNAVAHAEGYEVWLDGAFKAPCAAADTSMPLTGLTDGTTYSVQVKALGDNLHYGDSPLSTAISVTTPADAQKVDFTVTGAPTAPVFAGDTVSFTVTAEYESTHAAAPVSLSGIAGATFAAGAFSWTPTEADVGSNSATFTSGSYSTNVAITVVSAMETRTLATENFSKIASSSWSSTTGYTNVMDGDIGLWTGSSLIKTKSAVIVGRANSSGTIVSPAIDLPVRTPGSLSVSFDTGSLPEKQASFEARILDAADGTVLYTTNFLAVAALPSTATAVADAGVRVTVAPGANVALPAAIQLSLTTHEGTGDNSYRVYIDTVVFSQALSAKLRDLDAPTGLAVVGEPGENGFTVGWTAVSDATNYAVRVTDAAGAVVFSAPFCAAAPVAVAGLADDEAYAVRVRATGDEAVWLPSPWSDAVAVRTARSSAHPTLSFGGWVNAVGDGGLYAGVANTAAVSAIRDNGTNAVVTLESVSPAPIVGPTFEDNVLAWTPVDADTNKTFTISFLMDGTYATNLSFKVKDLAPLAPPTVTIDPVPAWDVFGLSWNTQYRAAGYAVRVWTDCPNPNATATRMEEPFANWPKVKPAGWSYHTLSSGYKDAAAPVAFDSTGDELKTYGLGGPISSVSFHAAGHSISNSTSTLTVVGIGADNTETVLATLSYSDIGQTAAGIDRTLSIPAGTDVRKIAWRYTKDKGGVGVGSVVIEGTGFSTARFLPGWGPVAKDVGLVQGCTVAKPRPGRVLGVDPSDPRKDLTAPRVNYAEVAVRDAAGATLSTIVEVDVPAPPRSARATMLILR